MKPFQKDSTYGRARGNTFGYHTPSSHKRERVEKFLYTGLLESVALSEVNEGVGNIGRLGIGLKLQVDAWEWTLPTWTVERGKVLNKHEKKYFSLDNLPKDRHTGQPLLKHEDLNRVSHECWVGDHFGIAVGVKVL